MGNIQSNPLSITSCLSWPHDTFQCLFASFLFAGELEVDGDLKVTGSVESTTIDSLKAVIADLQAQLAALQGAGVLQTRVYELPRFNFNGVSEMELDLFQITGYNFDYAHLNIIYVNEFSTKLEYWDKVNF